MVHTEIRKTDLFGKVDKMGALGLSVGKYYTREITGLLLCIVHRVGDTVASGREKNSIELG